MSMINTFRTLVAASVVASAAVFGANAASADDVGRWVYVNNYSDELAIDSIFIAHVDDPYWGVDLIRGFDVAPGENIDVEPTYVEGYCRFDVLLVFEDGYEMTLPEVDLCTVTDIDTDGYDYELYSI